MSIVINSFFTIGGVPYLGLTPSIRIWEVSGAGSSLVVGAPIQVTDPLMTEVGDGFYKFEFTAALGYDPTKAYSVRSDAGDHISPNERYSVGNVDEAIVPDVVAAFVNGMWDEAAGSHVSAGSMGLLQNQTGADAAQVRIDMLTAISLVQTLLKYEANRTKIDKVAKTLTVYDNDGITPLKIFDLKDSTGAPSIVEVVERMPEP